MEPKSGEAWEMRRHGNDLSQQEDCASMHRSLRQAWDSEVESFIRRSYTLIFILIPP